MGFRCFKNSYAEMIPAVLGYTCLLQSAYAIWCKIQSAVLSEATPLSQKP